MPPIVDPNARLSDWLAAEADQPPYFCREEVDVIAGEELRSGTLLKLTGTEYEAWAPGDTPAGFLITAYIPGDTTAPFRAVALVRGPATIKTNGVAWPDGITEAQVDAVKTALAPMLIVFRQSA